MTTKLDVYNLALGTYIGTQRLANLTEDRDARYALDSVYDGAVQYVLERGLWKFALRVVKLESADPADLDAQRQYLHPLPADYVRLANIGSDVGFRSELLDFVEMPTEVASLPRMAIASNVNPIYVRYISKDPAYGLNLARWPENFTQAVAAWLAYQSVLPINKDRGDRADLYKLAGSQLGIARQMDAINEAVKTKPPGNWPMSRGFTRNGTSRGLR